MNIHPTFPDRAAQSYPGIRLQVRRDQLPTVVPRALGELFGFLQEHEIAPGGPPLIRYRVVDYRTGEIDIDVGVPVAVNALPSNSRVRIDQLPAGRFAAVTHYGPYENLMDTTAALLDWAKQGGVAWKVSEDQGVSTWGARVEHYLVGPPDEKNPTKWQTEVAIQLSETTSVA